MTWSSLQRTYDRLVADEVRPFLNARGFTDGGSEFVRKRSPLYDVIEFQENWHNGPGTGSHGFFVNVSVGSTDVDAVWPISPAPLVHHGVLQRRWEYLVPELPYECRFTYGTDMELFAEHLCMGLDLVLTELARFDSTPILMRWAVAHNKLIQMEKTCCYLAAMGEIDLLTQYVAELRDCFGGQQRWTIFNRRIVEVTGAAAAALIEAGLLDYAETG